MLKTISAVLLAASVIAAPALAATVDKNTQAPTTKSAQLKKNTTVTTSRAHVKSSAINANAKMSKHVKHVRKHAPHKSSALKTHRVSKLTIKHAAPVAKRG